MYHPTTQRLIDLAKIDALALVENTGDPITAFNDYLIGALQAELDLLIIRHPAAQATSDEYIQWRESKLKAS